MNNGVPPTTLQVLRSSQTIGPLIGIFKSTNGTHWTRVNADPVQDDLETTIAKLQLEHAIHSPNSWIKVVDMRSGQVLHNQTPVVPHREIEQFFPPVDDEERFVKRNAWLHGVLAWCLPPALRHHAEDQTKARALKRWFKRHAIVVETHASGAMRVMRAGVPIAEWIV